MFNRQSIYYLLWLVLMVFLLPLRWLMASIIAAMVHELGHYCAVHLVGGTVHHIRIGFTGSVMEATDIAGYSELLCILAGPLAGLLLSLLIHIFPAIALCGIFQTLYNLLPLYPLDGGRLIRYIVLSNGGTKRCIRFIEYSVLVLLFLACIYIYLHYRISLFIIFATLLFRKTPCKHQRDWI